MLTFFSWACEPGTEEVKVHVDAHIERLWQGFRAVVNDARLREI